MTSDMERAARETAARSLLRQSATKIVAREKVLSEKLHPADKYRVVAELDLLKQVNALAAQEVVRWKAKSRAGQSGERS